MSQQHGSERRKFLRNVGITGMLGAAYGGAPGAVAAATLAPGSHGKYDFDTPYNRFGSNSVKYDSIIRDFGKGSIQVGMGVADMDFRAAPSITRALTVRMQHENWGYLSTPAAFSEGVISWNQRHYGITIDRAQLVFCAGVHSALRAALQTFSPPGSKVLLQTPIYNGFYVDLAASQTLSEDVPLRLVNGRYAMDFEQFEKQISTDTHSFILCNPHNPTGNCWSAEDLLRIGEICLKHRVVVLADEIHCDFVARGQQYSPFASLPSKAVVDNSITFKAASKSFSLAAHRVAWFHSTNADYLQRIKAHHRTELNTLGVVANMGAYTPEGEEWLSQVVDYIDGNTTLVEQFIRDKLPMVKMTKPQGTFLTWLDMTAYAEVVGAASMAENYNRSRPTGTAMLSPEEMLERHLVKHARVHLSPGTGFGTGGANHMRMNVATSRRTLELALDNLAAAMRSPRT